MNDKEKKRMRRNHVWKFIHTAETDQERIREHCEKKGHYRLYRLFNKEDAYVTILSLVPFQDHWNLIIRQEKTGDGLGDETMIADVIESLRAYRRSQLNRIIDLFEYVHEHPEELLFEVKEQYW